MSRASCARRIGAGDEFKDGCARGRGGMRIAAEVVRRRRCPQIVAGNQKVDLASMHFADHLLHLADRPEFEIDDGGVLEEVLQERAPLGEVESADAAFRGMSSGEEERSAQLREGARDLAQRMAKGVEAQLEQIRRVAQARRPGERRGRGDDGNKRAGAGLARILTHHILPSGTHLSEARGAPSSTLTTPGANRNETPVSSESLNSEIWCQPDQGFSRRTCVGMTLWSFGFSSFLAPGPHLGLRHRLAGSSTALCGRLRGILRQHPLNIFRDDVELDIYDAARLETFEIRPPARVRNDPDGEACRKHFCDR